MQIQTSPVTRFPYARFQALALGALAVCWSLSAQSAVDTAPLLVAPAPAAETITRAIEQTRPWQFAVPVALDIDAANDGVWQEVGDERIWRLQLQSPNASSISLHFDRWQLPPGAELRLFGLKSGQSQGPYDERFNARNGGLGELWSAMLLDETVELELRAPLNAAVPDLHLASLHHGFRSSDSALGFQTKAGSCNIDVACSEADPWQDQVNASVLLTIGGTGSCSGTLINNTRNDNTPYLLTADHCGISTSNDQSVITYFNFQRATCNGAEVSRDPQQSVSGSEFLAGNPGSDFTLVVLGTRNNPDIPDAAWNPYWAGWSRATSAPPSGVGIHHPSGDEKAISLYSSPLNTESVTDVGQTVQVWQVMWSAGTTERGSSGSAIFDDNGLIRGQLYGGDASCNNQSAPDFYGRFDVSWDNRSANNEQLKRWLDPNNMNPLAWGGLDAAGQYQAPPAPSASPSPTPSSAPTPTPTAQPTAQPTPAPGGSSGSGSTSAELLLLLALFGIYGHGRRRPAPAQQP